MAEYISKDQLHEITKPFKDSFLSFLTDEVDRLVDTMKPADVQPVVRCKDCVYRPYYEPSDSKSVSDLVFPDYRFNPCPCRVEDFWYSWMPDDDWFCAYGKRKDG